MIRNYVLRKQHNNKGFYAEIQFEVTLVNNNGHGLEITYLADPRWEIMCKAALLLFHDYFLVVERGDLKVSVHRINWLPVDTNNLIVMYACIAAMSDALNVQIEGFSFDLDRMAFVFPERRNSLRGGK